MNPVADRILMRRWVVLKLLVAWGLAASLMGSPKAWAGDTEQAAGEQAVSSAASALAELSKAFRRAAVSVQPAVVSISTTQTRVIHLAPEGDQSEIEDRVLEWFRRHGWSMDDETGDLRGPDTSGIGSGMIVDASAGMILTNRHVIEGATEITVRLQDGRIFAAELVNMDEGSDLAVVRIEADGLNGVVFGDSDEVQVGDFVLAFGSPLGFAQTITHGIVSAVGRNEPSIPVYYKNFIQTDAAINQGNSGGPLVNLRGEVIGMNTAIATRTGFDAGIGFAIPASRIRALLPRLKSGERIVRGYLGVVMKDVHLERRRAMALGWDEDRGVIIDEVHPDTPAHKGGLHTGDIILDFDGRVVHTGSDLQDRVAVMEPGTPVALRILRDRQPKTLGLTVGRQPDNFLEMTRRSFRGPRNDDPGEEPNEGADAPDPRP